MKRICPSCGREIEKLYDGLCYECYLKINKKEEEKKKKVYICKYCGRVKYHNKWYNNFNIDNFEYEYTVCPRCKGLTRKANLILQIRGYNKIIEDEILKVAKKNKDIIKKVDEINEKDIDIYLYVGKNRVKSYYNVLKKYGKVKLSKKLVGYDKNKGNKKYIVTILLRGDEDS